QRAFLAVDVRKLHVRFERVRLTGGSGRMNEKAVGQHWDLRRVLNYGRHGPPASLRGSFRGFRIDLPFSWRIYGQGHAVGGGVGRSSLDFADPSSARLSPSGRRSGASPSRYCTRRTVRPFVDHPFDPHSATKVARSI